jgi:hypothetical protein
MRGGIFDSIAIARADLRSDLLVSIAKGNIATNTGVRIVHEWNEETSPPSPSCSSSDDPVGIRRKV